MKTYIITLKHDAGRVRIQTCADSEQQAKELVCAAEHAPLSAVRGCRELIAKPQIRIFPNGQVEVGNGKPGYDWRAAYSQRTLQGVSNPLTLRQWRAIAKRDGCELVVCPTEKAAMPQAEDL